MSKSARPVKSRSEIGHPAKAPKPRASHREPTAATHGPGRMLRVAHKNWKTRDKPGHG